MSPVEKSSKLAPTAVRESVAALFAFCCFSSPKSKNLLKTNRGGYLDTEW